MSLFSYQELKSKYTINEKSYTNLYESAKFESANIRDVNQEFDIFLSHSYKDKEIIPYLKKELESLGYTVYVDWINDRFLSRETVNKGTAKVLQKRMRQSKSLLFATSENSSNSKWMPWELGYFDGIRNKRVAILPILKEKSSKNNFKGQEYLGLYYYVTINNLSKTFENEPMMMEPKSFRELIEKSKKVQALFIHQDESSFVPYNSWLDGEEPFTNLSRLGQILEKFENK